MKTHLFSRKGRWLAGVLIAVPLMALAQLSIDWSTIDGGGGTSSGGAYSMRGTIGQPDARALPMTGGSYAMTGGFWAIYAVQVEGAPFLSIEIAGPGQAIISWAPDSPGWLLQETSTLSTNWIDSASGSTNPVTVTVTNNVQFYRLNKP
jgi:hypothetical protein